MFGIGIEKESNRIEQSPKFKIKKVFDRVNSRFSLRKKASAIWKPGEL